MTDENADKIGNGSDPFSEQRERCCRSAFIAGAAWALGKQGIEVREMFQDSQGGIIAKTSIGSQTHPYPDYYRTDTPLDGFEAGIIAGDRMCHELRKAVQ